MPKNKDVKRLTRSRMEKTGESYTTARSQLLVKQKRAEAPAEPKPDYATLAGMSDDAVAAKTGHTWEEWVELLDGVDAASLPHKEIAEHVHKKHEVSGWWAQTVAVSYERIKGLREVGQRRSGSYGANKSKTYPVPVARLYQAFEDESIRERWLPGVEMTVRKATPERSMRITWEDDTSVELWFTAKGDAKSQVQVQIRKLGSKEEAEERKGYWGERLKDLSGILTAET